MDKKDRLNKLKEEMSNDAKLPLHKGATQLVFGEGDPNSEIMFIGEGPGYWEDKKGRPFVGNAGAFLNQLLVTTGLDRKGVFITNVIHHRPPQNRDPMHSEIKAYQPYLDQMIDIIAPKVIVTLGRYSMGKFLLNAKITSVHGKKFEKDWQGKKIFIVPMFHPAAGLRSTEVKQKTVDDFKKLQVILEEIKSKDEIMEEKVEQMNLI